MLKMKNILGLCLLLGGAAVITSCGSGKNAYAATYAPEEQGLNVVKITDESRNVVLGPSVSKLLLRDLTRSTSAGSRKAGLQWNSHSLLAVSPDGTEIAYLTRSNKQDNIMVRKAASAGSATQRTFRNVGSFSWGNDDNLYFSDVNESQNKICVINAHKGSLMRQLTSNNSDSSPVLSKNGKKVYFCRTEAIGGPAIWSYDLVNGELTNCARGYHPVLTKNDDEFICVRNNDSGRSEIWLVNYKNGQETLLVSDKERSFSNPSLSPDGNWLAFVGNTVSSVKKIKNLDIFVCRIDGSSMIQLTYHPANDACPQWGADGKSIYFISSRANKDESYNIWRINFNLH